jgi:hypothetical protein
MSFVCVTCDKKFETVPDDAVQITPDKRRVTSYRFADGTTHHLRYDASRGNTGKALHTRWHQDKKKPGMHLYCYPPPEPLVEQTEVTGVFSVLAELPLEPVAEECKAVTPGVSRSRQVVAAEVEPASMTAMEAAFRRSLKS